MPKISISEQNIETSAIIPSTEGVFVIGLPGMYECVNFGLTHMPEKIFDGTYYFCTEEVPTDDGSANVKYEAGKVYKGILGDDGTPVIGTTAINTDTDGVFVYPKWDTSDVDREKHKYYVTNPNINYEEPIELNASDSATQRLVFNNLLGDVPYMLINDETIEGFSTNATSTADNGSITFKKGSYDKGFVYAWELVRAGFNVYYMPVKLTKETKTIDGDVVDVVYGVANIYSEMTGDIFDTIDSPLDFKLKFITSGGYPTFEYDGTGDNAAKNVAALKMKDVAAKRGDCVALIDHTEYRERSILPDAADSESVYSALNGKDGYGINSEFAAMFTPWCTMSTSFGGLHMPASLAYLEAYGTMIENYPSWYAVAGTTRGIASNVSGLNTQQRLSNAIADAYQTDGKIGLNAITYIKSYGYVIWGNRTLDGQTTARAMTFLSQRNMVDDIKSTLYTAARSLFFEQNTDITWARFTGMVTPLLDKMMTGYGLSGYTLTRLASDKKTQIRARLVIQTVFDVEEFEIGIYINPDDAVIS